MDGLIRIAMWSGPRNISTAMMRAWGSRADTVVTDEPLYAAYLLETGATHPGRDEIIARHESDWQRVTRWLAQGQPGVGVLWKSGCPADLVGEGSSGATIWYQKHMAHHLLPGMDRWWIERLANCFLIRDPGEMITSYIKVVPDPSAEDLGLVQQVELFEAERDRTGCVPPVLDARDVLKDPRRMLGLLCEALGVAFDEAMLSWEPGLRETDGVWAKHWYDNVSRSTGFGPYKPKGEAVPGRLHDVYDQCMADYARLFTQRLQ